MLGERLKELRTNKKLSQEEIAKALGIAKNTYIRYEKEEQSPQLTTLEEIAQYHGTTVYELLSGKKPELESELETKLGLIQELEDEDKKTLMILLEGLLLRHQNKKLSDKFRK